MKMPSVEIPASHINGGTGSSHANASEMPPGNESVGDSFVFVSPTQHDSVSPSVSMSTSCGDTASNLISICPGLFLSDEETKLYNKLRDTLKENGKLKRAMAQNNKIVQEQVDRIQAIVHNQVVRIKDLTAKLEKEKLTSNHLSHELSQLKDNYSLETKADEEFELIQNLSKSQKDLQSKMQTIFSYIDDLKGKDPSKQSFESVDVLLNQIKTIQATQEELSHVVTTLSKNQVEKKCAVPVISDLKNRLEHQCSLVVQKDEELAKVKVLLQERKIELRENTDLLSKIRNENQMLKETSVEFKLVTPNCEQEIAKLEDRLREMTLHRNALKEERNALKEEIKSQEEEYKEVCSTFEDIEDENAKLRKKIALLEEFKSKDSDRINELMKANNELSRENEALRVTKDKWSLVGESSNDEIRKKDNEIHQLRQVIVSQHRANAELQTASKQLWMNLQIKTNQCTDEEKKAHQFKEIADKFKTDTTSLQEELQKSKSEYEAMKSEFEAMKFQLETYKSDFLAERQSKERVHSELMNLRDSYTNLDRENKRLSEDLDKSQSRTMADMQRRHPNPTRSSFDSPSYSPFSSTGSDRGHYAGHNGGPYGEHGNLPMQQPMHYPPSTQQFYSRGPTNQPDSLNTNGVEDRNDSVRQCPKCNKALPDLDSLQIHVMDCLDN